jgi:hypothetical protein
MNSKLIVKERKNTYSIFIKNEDVGRPEKLADIYNQEDTLLLSYFMDKFLNKEFDENDFQKYLVDNGSRFPFIKIPKK